MATRGLRATAARLAPPLVHRLWEQRVSRDSARALAALAAGPRPIVAGPWVSEVGFELLYWIPLLRALVERHGIPPNDVVAVSRGGAVSWYAGIAERYVDVLDWLAPEDLRAWQDRRAAEAASVKQGRIGADDHAVLAELRTRLALGEATWLHPSLMYRLFNVAWAWSGGARVVLPHLRFARLAPPATGIRERLALGDGPYVAVKAYFGDAFRERAANRAFLERTVAALAAEQPVVLLRTGFAIDDHVAPAAEGARLVDTAPILDPRRNLAEQTELVAGASALVTTYGGFAYLGMLLGVPTLAFGSDGVNPVHLDVARAAAAALGVPPPEPVDSETLDPRALLPVVGSRA